MFAGEEEGHVGCGLVLPIPAVRGEGSLPCLDRTGDVGRPPPGPGQAVQGRRRLLGRQPDLEGGPGVVPSSLAQRFPPG